MKKQYIYFMFLFVFSACDIYHFTEIKNQTNHEIIIKIKFNREQIEYIWDYNRNYIAYLRSYPNNLGLAPAIDFDSINLIKTFKIKKGESFPFECTPGNDADFRMFSQLLILKPDSILFDGIDEIKKAFIITEIRHSVLIIK